MSALAVEIEIATGSSDDILTFPDRPTDRVTTSEEHCDMFEESGVRCGEQRRVTLTAEERNEARILTAAAAVMDGRRNTLTIPRGQAGAAARREGGRCVSRASGLIGQVTARGAARGGAMAAIVPYSSSVRLIRGR